jgi:hypothetical protein
MRMLHAGLSGIVNSRSLGSRSRDPGPRMVIDPDLPRALFPIAGAHCMLETCRGSWGASATPRHPSGNLVEVAARSTRESVDEAIGVSRCALVAWSGRQAFGCASRNGSGVQIP